MFDCGKLESGLSEEERMIRDTVRTFVAKRVRPEIDTHYESDSPIEIISEKGFLGFYAPNMKDSLVMSSIHANGGDQ